MSGSLKVDTVHIKFITDTSGTHSGWSLECSHVHMCARVLPGACDRVLPLVGGHQAVEDAGGILR